MPNPSGSSSQQVTKRCHWVPQAYLRAFAADTECKKIWRFSKCDGEPELKPIEKVAVKFHLYAPFDKSTGRRDDSFEKKLSELERWFADPPWHQLKTGMLDLSHDTLRKMVSLLVATMMLRNPRHFDLYKRTHAELRDRILSWGEVPSSFIHQGRTYQVDTGSWPAYRDATEEDLRRNWISDINNAATFASQLMSLRWSVVVAQEPLFITTDAPVTFVHPSLAFRGLRDPQTSILFPISPTRLLCMDHLMHEPHNQYYPLRGSGASFNLLLWRNSIEYMFSHRHTDGVCQALIEEADRMEAAGETPPCVG